VASQAVNEIEMLRNLKASELDRTVLVEISLNPSGKVRNARALSGPAALRSIAITALTGMTYRVTRKSADFRDLKLRVTFAADGPTVTNVSQVVQVLDLRGAPIAGIGQVATSSNYCW
jgi:hypothetical protein